MNFKLFPSIFHNPEKIRFIEQEKNENIILFLRQHPIVNVPWILIALLITLVPVFAIQLDTNFNTHFFINIPQNILIGSIIVYYMIVLAYVIENFIFWYFNIYIVTNLHLVDVDFESLLSRTILEISTSDIQGASASITGIFASLFNFGDVLVKTAAEKQTISFIKVPRPDFVADVVNDLATPII